MTETIKQAKLIQYLSEAYGKEKELETALEAHIPMTTRKPYKKRLREHLKETKSHARELERRIKKIGGRRPAARREGRRPGGGKAEVARPGPAARGARHRRGREDAQEREDRVLQRARGDRDLHGDRGARRERRRPGDREARAGDPPRRGADGEYLAQPDPGADQGRRHRGDPGGRTARRGPQQAADDADPQGVERELALARARIALARLVADARDRHQAALELPAPLDPQPGAFQQLSSARRPRSGRATRASAASRSSSRKSGWATSASASPRWWTVRPCSSAAPYSVTITSTWWRGRGDDRPGVEPGDDPRRGARHRRWRSTAGRAARGRSSDSAGPAMKSSWPPMPEYWLPSIVSATTWPWMSTASAPLIVTILRLRPISVRRVDDLDRQERDLGVAVEPLVQLGGARRRRSRPRRRRTGPCGW